MSDLIFAAALLASLAVGLVVREWVKAKAIVTCGDAAPLMYGRTKPFAKEAVDPFGSVILPALLGLLAASGFVLPPFAYAKPPPMDPSRFRNPGRDTVVVALAGPAASLALAAVAGAVIRLWGPVLPLVAFMYANLSLCVINVLPVPGLDGSLWLARFMSPHPRDVYERLGQYLVLWLLLIYFLLGGIFLRIVDALIEALVRVLTGG